MRVTTGHALPSLPAQFAVGLALQGLLELVNQLLAGLPDLGDDEREEAVAFLGAANLVALLKEPAPASGTNYKIRPLAVGDALRRLAARAILRAEGTAVHQLKVTCMQPFLKPPRSAGDQETVARKKNRGIAADSNWTCHSKGSKCIFFIREHQLFIG